jgi:hypothetical protein
VSGVIEFELTAPEFAVMSEKLQNIIINSTYKIDLRFSVFENQC